MKTWRQVSQPILPPRNSHSSFQGLADLPREVRAQGQTDRQAAAPVDGAHSPGDADLLVHVDAVRDADGGGDHRLVGTEVQAVLVQLVGSQSRDRCVFVFG